MWSKPRSISSAGVGLDGANGAGAAESETDPKDGRVVMVGSRPGSARAVEGTDGKDFISDRSASNGSKDSASDEGAGGADGSGASEGAAARPGSGTAPSGGPWGWVGLGRRRGRGTGADDPSRGACADVRPDGLRAVPATDPASGTGSSDAGGRTTKVCWQFGQRMLTPEGAMRLSSTAYRALHAGQVMFIGADGIYQPSRGLVESAGVAGEHARLTRVPPVTTCIPMAKSGGFFTRLSNLWSGFLSLWVGDLEKNHPEIAYENSINSMVEKYTTLKKATAAIIRRREEIEQRYRVRKTSLDQVRLDLDTAMETEEDDLALVLISKKNALETEVSDLAGELDQARQDAEDAKASLLNVQAEIDKLKSEKDRMLAKMESSKARIQVQEQLEGLSVDAEVRALDNVRQHIETLSAEANLNKELQGQSMEGRLRKLRLQTGEVTARRELEELKAKRAQAAQQQAQKTL